jgi:bifunctional non-homologous end joining protein LigD
LAGSLGTYKAKRRFDKTPEPSGEPASAGDGQRFVIQEHHATALHWDFRLERGGVLVSWAVPKGIPEDPKVNHRAINTEDHPLEYMTFEGRIPEGEYGGGKVIIWDTGTYETEKWRDGEVIVRLHGKRARGKYVLFRTDGKDWMIHRMDPPLDPAREPMPRRILPMLAKLAGLPRDDANYGFEIKWDGVRAIVYVEGGRARAESRNSLDITRQYPELAALGRALGSREVVLDGELVALDASGRPSFERLQQRMGVASDSAVRRRMKDTPVTYMIFDLLYLAGHNTMALPYSDRRKLLQELELNGDSWATPAYHRGDGSAMLDASRRQGLEGIMAKRLDSAYVPGKRTSCWLKVKNSLRQELVVGGWTPGEGARSDTIGALLLGYYDGLPGQAGAGPQRLVYAGKVGTGFSEEFLRGLKPVLAKLARETSPFAVGAPPKGSRYVEPQLVADVEFTEWTRSGNIRHPSFKGLRTDKDAREVVREQEEAE